MAGARIFMAGGIVVSLAGLVVERMFLHDGAVFAGALVMLAISAGALIEQANRSS